MADTVDASIPLEYKFPQLPTAQSVAAAQQMQYRNQLAQLQVQDAQQQAQQKNAVLQLFQQPGAVDPQTGLPTDATIGKVSQVNPTMGLQLRNNVVAQQANQQKLITNNINQRLLGMNINDRQHDKMVDIATSAQDLYDNLLASGTSPQEASEQAGRQRNQQITDANKSGLIPNDVATTVQSPFNPVINKAFIAGSPQYKTVLAERDAAMRAKAQQDRENRLDEQAQRTAETAGQDPFMKEAASTYGAGTPEYKQAIKDHLAKESGAGGGAAGGREAVYTNRILSSANLASKDLANIARGPVSQSSGFFGGRTPGPGLLDAGKESLANALTSQEAQTYNVKLAGLQRNLAAIEAQGLAPSGSLTHQMDAIRFSATDTNWTKAYKLAEARQIVEGGMDVVRSNSRTDPGAKKLADQVVGQIRQVVPFTVEDIDNLASSKDPKATLNSFIKKQAGAQGAAAPAKPSSKAEYDALPSGTHVILPNGKEGVKP